MALIGQLIMEDHNYEIDPFGTDAHLIPLSPVTDDAGLTLADEHQGQPGGAYTQQAGSHDVPDFLEVTRKLVTGSWKACKDNCDSGEPHQPPSTTLPLSRGSRNPRFIIDCCTIHRCVLWWVQIHKGS